MIKPILNKTPYELLKGRKPNIRHLRVFGCKCYVHNNGKDALRKFNPRSDEAIFLGYSSHSKACKVLNKRNLCVEDSVHVLLDETNSLFENDAQDDEYELGLVRKGLLLTQNSMLDKGKFPEGELSLRADILEGGQGVNQSGGSIAEPIWNRSGPLNPILPKWIGEQAPKQAWDTASRTSPEPVSPSIPARVKSVSVDLLTPRPWNHQSSHPLDQILADINTGVQSRSKLKSFCTFYAFLSNIEPKNVHEALADSDWVSAMQEELHQFERNKV